jgi:hypothetical protein
MTRYGNQARAKVLSTTALGGTAVAALLMLAGPGTGQAHAHGYSTPPGDSVGRPGLDNPAPVVRLTQAVGDHIFNQGTPFNQAIDNSWLGQNFHATFGAPDYETPTHGSNGAFTGVLNSPGILKNAYNSAQTAGWSLPEEEDLSGRALRLVSGAPAPRPHDNSGALLKATPSAERAPLNCTVLTTRTVVRAQGSC